MKKRVRVFIYFGIAVLFLLAGSSPSWSSPFEFPYMTGDTAHVNLGVHGQIEDSSVTFPGDIPTDGHYSVYDTRSIDFMGYRDDDLVGGRYASARWDMGYGLTDTGFSIYSDISLSTSYDYWFGDDPHDVGYAYAYSGWEGGRIYDWLKLSTTPETPAGTILSFAIQTATSGTPWGNLEWTFTLNGITVDQSNYDQIIFDLEAGEEYAFLFQFPEEGLQTQHLDTGSLASGFDFYFSQLQTPVPVPGAIWLLGSGLAGLIGLRRKYFH